MRLNKSGFLPGWLLTGIITTPQADKGQEDAAPPTAKPLRTNIASTSKEKIIAHIGRWTRCTEVTDRHYQGEVSSSKEFIPRTQRSSGECKTIRVTIKPAKGVVPQREQSSARGRAQRRNPTATEIACGHDYIMRKEQRGEKLQTKGCSCVKHHSPWPWLQHRQHCDVSGILRTERIPHNQTPDNSGHSHCQPYSTTPPSTSMGNLFVRIMIHEL